MQAIFIHEYQVFPQEYMWWTSQQIPLHTYSTIPVCIGGMDSCYNADSPLLAFISLDPDYVRVESLGQVVPMFGLQQEHAG